MKLFIRYLKQKLPTIVLVAIFFVIFSVSFLLYRLPIEAVLYPSALCFGFGLSYMLYDFSKIKRLHKSLEDIAKLTAGMINSLPDAKTIAEDDYQAIITALKAEVYKLETAAGEKICRNERLLYHLGTPDKDPDSLNESYASKRRQSAFTQTIRRAF